LYREPWCSRWSLFRGWFNSNLLFLYQYLEVVPRPVF